MNLNVFNPLQPVLSQGYVLSLLYGMVYNEEEILLSMYVHVFLFACVPITQKNNLNMLNMLQYMKVAWTSQGQGHYRPSPITTI